MQFLHRIILGYYSTIIGSCIDETMKVKLIRKIEYHQSKLSV
ncbi:hypothetical protein HNQ94_003045 [Salirhabdus euzebyi]|uniref:Uncharacterized protein n=1 Tax=Salirhabdus euzebyi TaxID=394506 RepID=A0A841Q832_9BACI|nr:hypothetical protein [Salirhabdus euzebyi]MBB6454556.1 hypothetical protein [Salirhabdus euzebyi]